LRFCEPFSPSSTVILANTFVSRESIKMVIHFDRLNLQTTRVSQYCGVIVSYASFFATTRERVSIIFDRRHLRQVQWVFFHWKREKSKGINIICTTFKAICYTQSYTIISILKINILQVNFLIIFLVTLNYLINKVKWNAKILKSKF